ncbi:ABC transporter substrate-binding protein [Amycolatopsis acidicola]|uniref:ABC transporter substrate-binding protein n=1 Tax=Amycolatopsis acidicola TaxID=2596893 RepID=A0A5N0UZ09_9PSEU|nr:ABC transporter substrate-binding protein [Amycolatopsis acidicola]
MRAGALAAALALCSGLLAACGSSEADGLTEVTVGVGGNVFDTPMRVAAEKNFFRAQGLDVKFISLTASIGAAALQSDSVQFLNDSPNDFLTAVSRKIPEIAVSMDGGGNPLGLIVSTKFAAEHGLTSQSPPEAVAKALVGSTGGASSATTKGQAGLLMQEYGVDPASVHYVALPSPAADKASLANNQIDWFVTSEPIPLEVQDDGDGVVVASPDSVPAWSLPRSGYGQVVVVRQSFADENSDVVRRFVTAVEQGSAYARTHETEAVNIMKKTLTGVPDDVLLASLRLVDWPEKDTMSAEGWNTSMTFLGKLGSLPKNTKLPQSSWTNQYLPQ